MPILSSKYADAQGQGTPTLINLGREYSRSVLSAVPFAQNNKRNIQQWSHRFGARYLPSLEHIHIYIAIQATASRGCTHIVCQALYWVLGSVHTCNVTANRNTVSWQCGRDSWSRNVSKVGYAVTLRAFSVWCRYLAVASKGW